MKINFTDEAICEISAFFACAMETARAETMTMYNELVRLGGSCSWLDQVVNRVCIHHSDNLYDLIRKRFLEWNDSEQSLSSLVRASGLGEDCLYAAYNLESMLLDHLDEQLSGELYLAESPAVICLEFEEDVADVLERYKHNVEERQIKYMVSIAERAEGNAIYKLIGRFIFDVFEVQKRTIPAVKSLLEKAEARDTKCWDQLFADVEFD